MNNKNLQRGNRIVMAAVLFLFFVLMISEKTMAESKVKVEFFYENVCASCEGDADFYKIYRQQVSEEQRETVKSSVMTYNTFRDSDKKYYKSRRKEAGIPDGTSLPVLIVGNKWVSGYDQIERSISEMISDASESSTEANLEANAENNANSSEMVSNATDFSSLIEKVQNSKKPVIFFFTTNACSDCQKVKKWFGKNESKVGAAVVEYNIITDNKLDLLKELLRQQKVAEKDWNVPAVFFGDTVVTGWEAITDLDRTRFQDPGLNDRLAGQLEALKTEQNKNGNENMAGVSILTLAGAGILAGFNPCSISMLLMLLSLVVAEKSSVMKSGLIYLAGKYAAYLTIGLIIFVTASQLSDSTLQESGKIISLIMAALFAVAGLLYLSDAVRILRKDYRHIRTQLPVGLRRRNHQLIKKVISKAGFLNPLILFGLGASISLGEFFCTGQIYMASITYLLKDRIAGIWVPFLVYVTAMSIPTLIIIFVIQKSRNTDQVSEWMFRHLGLIKLLTAVLFFGFVLYFLF